MNLDAKDGAQVQKGTLLAKIDDSELRAQLKQAESNKQLAQQKYDRAKALYEKDGAPSDGHVHSAMTTSLSRSHAVSSL